jgi:hypothetical protein
MDFLGIWVNAWTYSEKDEGIFIPNITVWWREGDIRLNTFWTSAVDDGEVCVRLRPFYPHGEDLR